jgi:hypothetical protein
MSVYDWQQQAEQLFDFSTNKTTCFLCPRRTGKTRFLQKIYRDACRLKEVRIIKSGCDLSTISEAKMLLIDDLDSFGTEELTLIGKMAGKIPIIAFMSHSQPNHQDWTKPLSPCSVHSFVVTTEYLGCEEC